MKSSPCIQITNCAGMPTQKLSERGQRRAVSLYSHTVKWGDFSEKTGVISCRREKI